MAATDEDRPGDSPRRVGQPRTSVIAPAEDRPRVSPRRVGHISVMVAHPKTSVMAATAEDLSDGCPELG